MGFQYGKNKYGKKSLSFSSDGKNIIAKSSEHPYFKLWNLKGNEIKINKLKSKEMVLREIPPDGNGIYTGSNTGVIKLWDFKGNLLKDFKKQYDYPDESILRFSPDGKTFLTKTSEGLIRLRDFKGNILQVIKVSADIKEIQSVNETTFAITKVSFSPDGKIIIIKTSDGRTHFYETYHNYLEHKVQKFSLQELFDAGVQLTAEDLKKVNQKK
ncbi:MAG: WD40 repeat domain-containing protein [Saprospiraceae bacterium]